MRRSAAPRRHRRRLRTWKSAVCARRGGRRPWSRGEPPPPDRGRIRKASAASDLPSAVRPRTKPDRPPGRSARPTQESTPSAVLPGAPTLRRRREKGSPARAGKLGGRARRRRAANIHDVPGIEPSPSTSRPPWRSSWHRCRCARSMKPTMENKRRPGPQLVLLYPANTARTCTVTPHEVRHVSAIPGEPSRVSGVRETCASSRPAPSTSIVWQSWTCSVP